MANQTITQTTGSNPKQIANWLLMVDLQTPHELD